MKVALQPLISVCVPAYNCEKYIQDTLACLCGQSYENIEIIVVDDGSTDKTAAAVKSITDPRIKFISVANGGAARARNIAYGQSKGKYLIFFDADDIVLPGFVTSQFDAMQNKEDTIVMSSLLRFYDNIDHTAVPPDDLAHIYSMEAWIVMNWYRVCHNTPPGRLLIPRKIMDKAGAWNEALSLNDDFEFFTRIAVTASSITPNKPAVYNYRSGVNGLSTQKHKLAYSSLFRSMELSFDLVLPKYQENESIKRAIANIWQSFIYEAYPSLKNERKIAALEIKKLGGTTFAYPAGGWTQMMVKLLGWKIAKRIKLILNH